MNSKKDYLQNPIQHIDIKKYDVVPVVDAMKSMAYSARDLSRAADIYDRMIREEGGGVILCLAGSLISAGLKKVFVDMIQHNMVDAIVSSGANIVDQDFFEGLGFKHYIAEERLKAGLDDNQLRDLCIDRIYDTLIDEDELRVCDETVHQIADSLDSRPYSSREFIYEMGAYLAKNHPSNEESIVRQAYEHDVPIFCPAFSDCSAGFGLLHHQYLRGSGSMVTIDSVRDFGELTQIKIECKETGIFMIGGGVPKNFTQDIVVAADVIGKEVPMHKYAVQITVADVRDGALSGSTLKEASSWGKVDTTFEQMVYSEATVAVPLIAGYAYHKKGWEGRSARRFNRLFESTPVAG